MKNLLIKLLLLFVSLNVYSQNTTNITYEQVNDLDKQINKKIQKEINTYDGYYYNNLIINTFEDKENNIIFIFNDLIINNSSNNYSIIELPFLLNENILINEILLNNEKINALNDNNKLLLFIDNKNIKNKNDLYIKILKKNNLDLQFILTKPISDIKINNNNKNIKIQQENNENIIISNNNLNNSKLLNKNTNIDFLNYNLTTLNNIFIEKDIYLEQEQKTRTKIIATNRNTLNKEITINYLLDENENVWSKLTKNIKINNNVLEINFFANEEIIFETKLKNNIYNIKNNTKYIQKINIHNDYLFSYEVLGGINYSNYSNNTWFIFPDQEITINYKKLKTLDGNTIVVNKLEKNINKSQYNIIINYTYTINSSMGQDINIDFPKEYNVKEIFLNNVKTYNNDKLFISNGINQLSFNLEKNDTFSLLYKIPEINLYSNKKLIPINNIESNINIEKFDNKFFVYSWGSDIYPSMYLIVIVLFLSIISYFLSKMPNTILNFNKWFIILLGVSQISIVAVVLTIILFTFISKKISKNYTIESFKNTINSYNFIQLLFIILSLIVAHYFFSSMYYGLLSNGNSYIYGLNSNYSNLYFYSYIPKQINILWFPSYIYNSVMFIWSFYVAINLINLSKYWWQALTTPAIFIKK